jgi:hypothetical protein
VHQQEGGLSYPFPPPTDLRAGAPYQSPLSPGPRTLPTGTRRGRVDHPLAPAFGRVQRLWPRRWRDPQRASSEGSGQGSWLWKSAPIVLARTSEARRQRAAVRHRYVPVGPSSHWRRQLVGSLLELLFNHGLHFIVYSVLYHGRHLLQLRLHHVFLGLDRPNLLFCGPNLLFLHLS